MKFQTPGCPVQTSPPPLYLLSCFVYLAWVSDGWRVTAYIIQRQNSKQNNLLSHGIFIYMRVIACSLWVHMVAAQINILLTEVCQITWEVNGEKVKVVWCGQKDECVDGGEGAGEQCGRYSYRELSDGDCAKVCCPQMSIKSITKTLDMEECEGWYRARAARAVWLPILGVTLTVTIIVSLLFTFRYGYQTNPYNGERKWVGCCCCKKPPDFGIDHPPPEGKVQTDPMQVVPY